VTCARPASPAASNVSQPLLFGVPWSLLLLLLIPFLLFSLSLSLSLSLLTIRPFSHSPITGGQLQKAGTALCKLGIETARKALGVPAVLLPTDMSNPELDEISMMTYLNGFRVALLKPAAKSEYQEADEMPMEVEAFDTPEVLVHNPANYNRKQTLRLSTHKAVHRISMVESEGEASTVVDEDNDGQPSRKTEEDLLEVVVDPREARPTSYFEPADPHEARPTSYFEPAATPDIQESEPITRDSVDHPIGYLKMAATHDSPDVTSDEEEEEELDEPPIVVVELSRAATPQPPPPREATPPPPREATPSPPPSPPPQLEEPIPQQDLEPSGSSLAQAAQLPPSPPMPEPAPVLAAMSPAIEDLMAQAKRCGLEVVVLNGPDSEFELDQSARGVRRGLSYVPRTTGGTYEVHITWNGKPIPGSPFFVDA
jgi:hypothetical protein